MADRPALAVTVADAGGHFLPGLERQADQLRTVFHAVGAAVTEGTSPAVIDFLRDVLGAEMDIAPPNGQVGRHRREALGLALRSEPAWVLYSDIDHVLRWLDASPAEVGAALARGADTDMLVIGRSPAAMALSPARLRETERLVNHIYRLMTGRDWDLMFAVRHVSTAVARTIIAGCVEDSIANDVEWPLFVESAGFRVDYFAVDGLTYRISQDFDTAVDQHDDDPRRWISRVGIANMHAQVLKRFIVR